MTCKNCTCTCTCNCGCQTQQNHNQKSKPKGLNSKKTNKHRHRHCTCDEDIYIPEPYTSNCCDGKRIVGGTQGNVEKADCVCAHINKYY